MSEDHYRALRELPFDVVAGRSASTSASSEAARAAASTQVHAQCMAPRRTPPPFSYSADGKWHCFSCNAKGRGSIDLAMAVSQCGFQQAVDLLEPFAGAAVVQQAQALARKPELHQLQEQPTENPVFKNTYDKFFKPHPWLAERGLTPTTLERFGSGYYENPTRKSIYQGSVMLKISRYSDRECVGYLSRNIGEITPEKPKYRFPVVPNHTREEALAVAERLRKEVNATPHTSRSLTLSISVGVSVFPTDGKDLQALKAAADSAAYDSKQWGRNLVRYFGEAVPDPKAVREPERRMPEPGALSETQRSELRRTFFRDGVARCPNDDARMDVIDMTAQQDPRDVIHVHCPQCGLSETLP